MSIQWHDWPVQAGWAALSWAHDDSDASEIRAVNTEVRVSRHVMMQQTQQQVQSLCAWQLCALHPDLSQISDHD